MLSSFVDTIHIVCLSPPLGGGRVSAPWATSLPGVSAAATTCFSQVYRRAVQEAPSGTAGQPTGAVQEALVRRSSLLEPCRRLW